VGGPPAEFVELLAVARGYQRSRALTVAAELGIADLLVDGPVAVDELAAATGSHEATLYRVLRALAAIGVFREDAGRCFALTPMGEYLRSDHPLSVRPVAVLFGSDYEWEAWGELPESVRTGRNGVVLARGVDVWEHRRRHPEDGVVFDAAMRTFSRSDVAQVVATYDFARHHLIADVGGGTGAVLAALLDAAPSARGILFDQPQVVAEAPPVLEDAGVADRVTVVGGSFFEEVPGGADLYVLRRILHDWEDEEAGRILRSVRRAMADGAHLLVIDAVVGPPGEDPLPKFLDLMMLVSAGGRERTEAEWEALLAAGGFRLVATAQASASSAVLEAVPV
jgi:hypothetical protein